MVSLPKIAVVGAGVAGITAASRLHAAGFPVVLFDKSRGLGGRLATRRWPSGVAFDHGAPYFHTENPDLAAVLSAAGDNAAPWEPRSKTPLDHTLWVGAPRMNAWLKRQATDIKTHLNTPINAITANGTGWTLGVEKRKGTHKADIVVLAAPTPQSAVLAAAEPALAAQLDAVEYAPCWTLMFSLKDHINAPFDLLSHCPDDSPLAWLGRNAGKPGRDVDNTGWVAHARADWSAEHLEISTEAAIAKLMPAAIKALGLTRDAVDKTQSHRWRYANVTKAAGEPYLQNTAKTVFAIGDGCLGGGVEGAFKSGAALATELIKQTS